jgi:hypothetical protein
MARTSTRRTKGCPMCKPWKFAGHGDSYRQPPGFIQDFAAIAADHPPVASPAEPDRGSPSAPQTPAQIPAQAATPRVQQRAGLSGRVLTPAAVSNRALRSPPGPQFRVR